MSPKQGDWVEHLGESSLPDDAFTYTTGNNFGLDGFQFDTPYNEGVEDGATLPETMGISGLPDGIIVLGEEQLDVRELTESDDGIVLDTDVSGESSKEASLVDLQWLDPTQEQDPDRLPNNEKTLDSISQLEEAWGVDRRTDGVFLIPNKDLDVAQYEESLASGPKSRLPGTKTAEDVRDAVLHALRRAHFHQPLDSIKRDLVAMLGHDAVRTRAAVAKIKEEYGLLGNVFVLASAFPGLKNGQWVKEVRRSCKTARYVITDDQTVADKLGMQMVSSVPWDEALAYYRSTFVPLGYHFPSPFSRRDGKTFASGNPREILRRGFLVGPKGSAPKPSTKPVVRPTVASQEAVAEAFARPVERAVLHTAEERAYEAKRKRALVQIARWVKEGRLSQRDAWRLRDSQVHPDSMLSTAAELLVASQSQTVYAGEGTRVSAQAQQARQQIWASLEAEEKQVQQALQRQMLRAAEQVVRAGLLTKEEATRILKMGKTVNEVHNLLMTAVESAPQLRQQRLDPTVVKAYQGVAQYAMPQPVASLGDANDLQSALFKKARMTVLRVVKAGLLTKDRAQKILGSCKTADETTRYMMVALEEARALRASEILSVPVQEYKGASQMAAPQSVASMGSDRGVQAALEKRVQASLAQAVKAGVLTREVADAIRKSSKTADEQEHMLLEALQQTVPTREYQGQKVQAAPTHRATIPDLDPQRQKIHRVAQKSGIKAQEFESLLKWARQQMSSGVAGEELDFFLRGKYASPLLKAASGLLKEVRAEHEGLSGHAYVDAAAYATPKGVSGCERGATLHRTNQIKYVMAMSRCASCTLKNADGVCSQYNKKLVSSVPVGDPAGYQQEMIRLANAPQEEKIANLFNPSEFSLQNDAYIELDEDTQVEGLGDVVFGTGPEL